MGKNVLQIETFFAFNYVKNVKYLLQTENVLWYNEPIDNESMLVKAIKRKTILLKVPLFRTEGVGKEQKWKKK